MLVMWKDFKINKKASEGIKKLYVILISFLHACNYFLRRVLIRENRRNHFPPGEDDAAWDAREGPRFFLFHLSSFLPWLPSYFLFFFSFFYQITNIRFLTDLKLNWQGDGYMLMDVGTKRLVFIILISGVRSLLLIWKVRLEYGIYIPHIICVIDINADQGKNILSRKIPTKLRKMENNLLGG